MGLITHYLLPYLIDNWLLLVLTALVILFIHRLRHGQPHSPATTQGQQEQHGTGTKVVAENVEPDDKKEEENDELIPPLWSPDLEHVPYIHTRLTSEESVVKSQEFYTLMNQRRSVRFFSPDSIPRTIIENIIKIAGTGPSGAHTEPWTFVAVSKAEVKRQIRDVVEAEEKINYTKRMGKQWVNDLKVMKTTWEKEYLTEAPWLILVFKQTYGLLPDGQRRTHYYNEISTALAGGLMITAIHVAGLVTLTSTPLNCGPSLRVLLNRPKNEKLLLLLPVGYPTPSATVPNLTRKPLDEILIVV